MRLIRLSVVFLLSLEGANISEAFTDTALGGSLWRWGLRLRPSTHSPYPESRISCALRPRYMSPRMQGSEDDEFEKWYAKEKQFGPGLTSGGNNQDLTGSPALQQTSPHAVGDVVHWEERQWTITRQAGRDGAIWLYDAKADTGSEVQLQVLSLKGMGGRWKGLDELKQREMVYRALSHPGVPQHIASFNLDSSSDSSFYLVLQQPGGQSLDTLLSQGWRPTEKEAVTTGLQLLGILEYLQSLRPPVQHLNLSPETIFVDRAQLDDAAADDNSKTACWIAGFAPSDDTKAGVLSDGYLHASAVFSTPPLSADIYSVGALLLRLVSGKSPADVLLGSKTTATADFRDEIFVSQALGDAIEGMLEMGQRSLDAASQMQALREAKTALQRCLREPESLAAIAPRPSSSLQLSQGTEVAAPKPFRTKIELTVTPSRLELVIPNAGLSAETVSLGGFTVTWNAIVGAWTGAALVGGAPLLFTAFSIPFWMAGAGLTKQTFDLAFKSTTLVIDRPGTFSIVQDALQMSKTVAEGRTRDLLGCREYEVAVRQDGAPVTELRLVEGGVAYPVGVGINQEERRWLCKAINDFLGKQVPDDLDVLWDVKSL